MFKKTAHITLLALLILLVLIMSVSFVSNNVYAEETEDIVTHDGFTFHIWTSDGVVGSLWLEKYSGTDTTVKLPTHIIYEGKEIPVYDISNNAFAGNQTVQKIIIPNGYQFIGEGAFSGCSNLKEIIIGSLPTELEYVCISDNAFADCPDLTTIVVNWNAGPTIGIYNNCGFGQRSSDGSFYDNVNIYVGHGSAIESYLQEVNTENKLNIYDISTVSAKTAEADYKLVLPGSAAPTVKPASDVNPGQNAEAVKKYLETYKSESDPKGSSFSLLQAKASKVTKNYIKLSYKKPSGTIKFMIFASKCGSKNKLRYLKTVKTKSFTQKKLKKGTYYKYLIVAVNSKEEVVSTSKVIHAATKGGKAGNDKKVTTKAKTNKVTLKEKKTFSLKAKTVPASSKLKVKKHRNIKYESSNIEIAAVSSKGVIKAKKKGACYVFAYAQNGIAAKIKVTVK